MCGLLLVGLEGGEQLNQFLPLLRPLRVVVVLLALSAVLFLGFGQPVLAQVAPVALVAENRVGAAVVAEQVPLDPQETAAGLGELADVLPRLPVRVIPGGRRLGGGRPPGPAGGPGGLTCRN